MKLGSILETAIGIVFVYTALSLIVVGISEFITQALTRLRSRFLFQGLKDLIGGKDRQLLTEFMTLLVPGFAPAASRRAGGHGTRKPAAGASDQKLRNFTPDSVTSGAFARSLVDALAEIGTSATTIKLPVWLQGTNVPETLQQFYRGLEDMIDKTGNPRLKALRSLLQEAKHDVAALRKAIGDWFDQSMTAVTQWYTRRLRWITIGIAAALTIGLNADTVGITRALWTEPGLRSAAVAAAEGTLARAEQPPDTASAPDSTQKPLLSPEDRQTVAAFHELPLPVGWSKDNVPPRFWWGWPVKFAGWLLTAFAISLGAPFWFDMLRRLAGLRSPAKTG
ncbi:hypothetical protein FJY71_01410 [candidate division WOR-3 bacterium]|nr:hypothetical protein [candidate division WOR-3 bacterium]